MGDTVVGQLRFLALSPEEFCKGPAKSGLLTRDECYAVFMNMAIPGIVALPKGSVALRCVERRGIFPSLERNTPKLMGMLM